MGRAPCCDKANVKKGPWSPEEDAKLKAYIEQHGTGGNWIALPQKIGLKRCGKSCRLRWLNYLRPNIKHGGFSEEEDNIICSLYVSIGSRWSIIAAQLPGRTDNDIKNYWNTRLKKKLLGKQRNYKDHQHAHAHAQARRLTTLKHHQQQQQDQIMKQREHHHHLVSSSSGVLITNNQTTTPTPNYWPVVEHCAVAAPIMPLIIPNNNNNNNASTIQQDEYYDQSPSSLSSFLKELDGIKFSHDQQPQPYIINSHENQLVYHPTTMMLSTSDAAAANIFQGYYDENLFPTSGNDDGDLMMSHLVSVNPPPQEITQGACLYGSMESMEMAISGSTNTSSTTTDQSTSYSWGDMTTSLVTNYSPNLVSTDHHYNNEDNGCQQAGIPPRDAAFQDSNRYFGIQLQ